MLHRMVMTLFVLVGILIWCEASSGATPLESLIPRKDLPKEWTLIHGPQIYNKKSLFEHINGQAELFLQYGFQKSVFAIYQNKERKENQIEADIYDMGNVVQAFGVFSRFRNEDRPGGFGLDSYLDDHTALFYKSKYFVLLYATESNPDSLRQFSKLISSKILDSSPPLKVLSYFPKNGLKSGSIQYFPEGLLGHKFLKKGFRATYVDDEKESHLFLSVFKDPQEATNALKVYKEDLSKKGKISSANLIPSGIKALKGEDPYQGKVMVLQKGFYLLGVIGFEKEENAENRLAEFVKNVK
ncbi:MAG: hypothetical protein A2157_07110 [Deltaproteobacteria bacterium RBG_16_47_11]|nr:MAG: hypothetical protein A2157_07110 [Deltaproteobacteria bacterium RBG_16_47_11]